MTAREMFEKLGYEEEPVYFEIKTYCRPVYSKGYIYYARIQFFETTQTVEKNLSMYASYAGYEACERHLTIDEIKAIHKQCEELGWLDV